MSLIHFTLLLVSTISHTHLESRLLQNILGLRLTVTTVLETLDHHAGCDNYNVLYISF
jgi:hypothetical protein